MASPMPGGAEERKSDDTHLQVQVEVPGFEETKTVAHTDGVDVELNAYWRHAKEVQLQMERADKYKHLTKEEYEAKQQEELLRLQQQQSRIIAYLRRVHVGWDELPAVDKFAILDSMDGRIPDEEVDSSPLGGAPHTHTTTVVACPPTASRGVWANRRVVVHRSDPSVVYPAPSCRFMWDVPFRTVPLLGLAVLTLAIMFTILQRVSLSDAQTTSERQGAPRQRGRGCVGCCSLALPCFPGASVLTCCASGGPWQPLQRLVCWQHASFLLAWGEP